MLRRGFVVAAVLLAVSGVQAQGDLTAQDFVDRVSQSDMFDLAAGRLALERSRLPAVRDFADRMVLANAASSGRLSEVLAGGVLVVPTNLDADGQARLARLVAIDTPGFDAAYVTAQKTASKAAVELFSRYAATGADTGLRAFAAEMLPSLRSQQNEIQGMN